MKLICDIAEDLNVPKTMLEQALIDSRRLVKHLKINKKDSSKRTVYQPSKKLKIIQYWLNSNIFTKLNIHDSAVAYQPKCSIKFNAIVHQKSRYFLKLDFKDFFPSIKFQDLVPYLQEWHFINSPSFDEEEMFNVVRNACFYKNDSLPIGYPTSPIISNIVMYNFDSKITANLSDIDRYGKSYYTRYADDLTFSTNSKGACKSFRYSVSKLLRSMESPKLKLNPKKTKYVSSSGGSAFITGLRICHDGHITIHRKYKDRVRLLLSLYDKGVLSEKEQNSLKGHLSYIYNVDSRFYTKLQKKYFNLIKKLIS